MILELNVDVMKGKLQIFLKMHLHKFVFYVIVVIYLFLVKVQYLLI
jgi:hypothetical protein